MGQSDAINEEGTLDEEDSILQYRFLDHTYTTEAVSFYTSRYGNGNLGNGILEPKQI